MNALEWLKAPNRAAIRPVCVVFGDDAFLVRESITAVGHAVFPEEDSGAGISRFAGAATPLATVLDEVRTLPFFSRIRLVIVEDADPFVTKYRKDLEAYAEKPCQSGILLLQVKTWPSTTRLAKMFESAGLPIDCSSPKEVDLVPWISQIASARFGEQLDAAEARLLLELVGPESGILVAELEKPRSTRPRPSESTRKISSSSSEPAGSRRSGRPSTRRWRVTFAPRSSTSTVSSPTAKSRSGCSPRSAQPAQAAPCRAAQGGTA